MTNDPRNLPPELACLHAGLPAPEREAPFGIPPVFASTYHLQGDPAGATFPYGRDANPTWLALEEALGALEGGEAVLFPSGMAAAAAALTPFLQPGDRVLLPKDGYHAVRYYAESYLARFGVVVDKRETRGLEASDLKGYRIVWVETPSNPGLELCDVAAVAEKVHRSGNLVVCDNTTMTPLGQRCLDLGADLVIASDTKAVNGHSDLLMGHVATQDPELLAAVRQWRKLSGSIVGPMEAWLCHRGLQTLELRFERMCASAQAVAERFAGHPTLEALRYPGLPGDPGHALATRQMRRFGSLVALTFPDQETALAFETRLGLIFKATSFGGTHSSIDWRYRWDPTVHPGLLRLSLGCEPTEALLDDLEQAFAAL
ncbi:cystathionine gamma-lyase [Tistlia consotensis]|uniref:Cystathionine gamma-lyase n=1 Tax=Tistlia consotensis USBA 355 TaxID=560819 RepID=A0A1Y6CJL6_9PROT|nr:cystathionine gamma-lyase [Tistlia consotensis]SMF67290.1 cystathionine gamma-lyase [Tistlia consotensis USBA 355]SNS00060.1 cystathionine gamma-lyase [Tistlia consotensis]